MIKKYRWEAPAVFKGDRIRFLDHSHFGRKAEAIGKVAMIKTRYDHKNEAYHVYIVDVDGWKRNRAISSEQIIELL